MGSSNQNEMRKEHRLRDMPPLGPMQKKSRVSEKIVGLGYFSTNLGFVLAPVCFNPWLSFLSANFWPIFMPFRIKDQPVYVQVTGVLLFFDS